MRGKNILLLSMVVLFSATTLTATANAETYTVEMNQNGFSVNSLSINDGFTRVCYHALVGLAVILNKKRGLMLKSKSDNISYVFNAYLSY